MGSCEVRARPGSSNARNLDGDPRQRTLSVNSPPDRPAVCVNSSHRNMSLAYKNFWQKFYFPFNYNDVTEFVAQDLHYSLYRYERQEYRPEWVSEECKKKICICYIRKEKGEIKSRAMCTASHFATLSIRKKRQKQPGTLIFISWLYYFSAFNVYHGTRASGRARGRALAVSNTS